MTNSKKNSRAHRYRLDDEELDAMTHALVAKAEQVYGAVEGADYVRQIVGTAMRLVRDKTDLGDLKLINNAFKELRHSLYVFHPFEQIRKVAVFGSARIPTDDPAWEAAREFAERITSQGWMVITGAGPGIMAAAQGGAGRKRSFGVNIRLPFEQTANQFIAGDRKLINFRYFFTRKVMFVKESHAIVLFPGGFGTHDEGFEALTLVQTGKSEILPLVFIDRPGGTYWKDWEHYVETHLLADGLISPADCHLYKVTDRVDEAVQEILNFYSNYHSSRYVRDRFVIRVRRAPGPEAMDRLNEEFRDILTGGKIEVSPPLAEEGDQSPELARVLLRFNRRDSGRLRQLIDALNRLVPETMSSPETASPHRIFEEKMPEVQEVAEGDDA
jgi:uncharacterized protein (TIGR00730 family)